MTTAAAAFDAALDSRASSQAKYEAGRLRLAVEASIYASQKHGLGEGTAMQLGSIMADTYLNFIRSKWASKGLATGDITSALGDMLDRASDRQVALDHVCEQIDRSKMEFDGKKRIESEQRSGITRSGYQIGGRVMGTREY